MPKHDQRAAVERSILVRFKEACRSAGLKLTQQRLEIFLELARAIDHPSAETLYRSLQERLPTLSLDTVYRTLASLEKHGLIDRLNTRQSQARFEVVSDQHHHLVCINCREIIDFHWASFDRAALPEEIRDWGRLIRRNVTLQGICQRCLAEEQA